MAKHLYHDTKTPIDAICTQFGVTRPTLYRYVGPKRPAAAPIPQATEDTA